jgi:hypothetical protein
MNATTLIELQRVRDGWVRGIDELDLEAMPRSGGAPGVLFAA